MITAKRVLDLKLSEGGKDQLENPCTITIIRVGDLAGSLTPELNGARSEKYQLISFPELYNLEPFARSEEPLELEIGLYQMEPTIDS